jgi:hypothetical protein
LGIQRKRGIYYKGFWQIIKMSTRFCNRIVYRKQLSVLVRRIKKGKRGIGIDMAGIERKDGGEGWGTEIKKKE